MTEAKQVASQQGLRAWAHRVLDELLDEVERLKLYGEVGIDMTAERGIVVSIVRRHTPRCARVC